MDIDEERKTVEQVKIIQKEILDIFSDFKGICDKYGLAYFAIGGTCIGAVRHKGFIPWDDDLDVAMPYQDYIRFQSIAKRELGDSYYLIQPKSNIHWCDCFVKLQSSRGIFMDIMPIYGLPKGKVRQYLLSVICDMLIFLNSRQRQSYKEQDSRLRRITWILNLPVKKHQKFYYYSDCIERIFKKYPLNNSNKVIFGWRQRPSWLHKKYTYQNIFYYKDFSKMRMCPFEDTKIAIPCGYDRYLTMDFGDYMTLPPVEERIPSHTAEILDLDMPSSN